ncbi:hypothetical protein ACQ4PT_019155 [Festuca glaucescens]
MEKQKQLASKSKTTSGSGVPAPLQSAIVSTAGKPPRAQPARARRPPTSDVQAEGGEIIAVGDESEDEWIEVDDDYQAIDEADKIDMDDEMSEPSLGLGDGQNDNEFEEVRSIEMPKKAGNRKITQVADGKAKVNRTRAKRSECWKYFKEVKAVSKKRPGEVVKKAKCLHCFDLFAYGGGSTTSLNRHKDACPIILNKKAKLLRQGSNYPTANIFYPYIMNVKIAVNTHAVQSNDENLKAMGKAMLGKFDKYWDSTYTENGNDSGRNKRKVKNNVMVIATILDPRYPVIAKIARKFLTVPATSVSSESTFSIGGRVLDDYRSSLRPKMVEALVCAASFIKGSKDNYMRPMIPTQDDSDDDVEFIPFPDSSVGSN